MKRFLFCAFAVAVVAGITAAPVSAQFGAVVTGTVSVSSEIAGDARGLTVGEVTYEPNQDVVDFNTILLVLTGSTFDGSVLSLCFDDASIASKQTVVGSTETRLQISIDEGVTPADEVARGELINVITESGNAAGNQTCGGMTGGDGFAFNLDSSETPQDTAATIQLTLENAGLELHKTNEAKLASVVRETNALFANSSSHIIDVIDNDGDAFVGGSTLAETVNAIQISQTDNTATIEDTDGNGSIDSPRIATLRGSIQITTTTTGITRLYLASGGTGRCNSSDLVGEDNPTGPVTLDIPSSVFSETNPGPGGAINLNLCARTDGSTFLDPRSVTGVFDFVVESTTIEVNDPPATGLRQYQSWNINGSTFAASGTRFNPPNDVTFLIANLGTADGSIRNLDVYRVDNNVQGTGSAICTLETSDTDGFTIWGNGGQTLRMSQIAGWCDTAGQPLDDAGAYGVVIVTDTAPNNTVVSANRSLGNGTIVFNVPILKGSGIDRCTSGEKVFRDRIV